MSKKKSPKLEPSLLEPQSRGGETNQRGMDFQAAVMMTKLPGWLARESFTALIKESLGDFEASFLVTGTGMRREFLESKDHMVAPSEFWQEIERFHQMHASNPGEFAWFTLVCTGLSEPLHPLVHGLRRVRDPYEFYSATAPVVLQSLREFREVVTKLNRPVSDADFIFERVKIEPDWSLAGGHEVAIFKEEVERHFPAIVNPAKRPLAGVHADMLQLIRSKGIGPISRRELEHALLGEPNTAPIALHTNSKIDEPRAGRPIIFDWSALFPNDQPCAPSAEWNRRIVDPLRSTGEWIRQHRDSKQIALTGDRRLSPNFAVGATFPAVSGFSIMVDVRGQMWHTDEHATAATPAYSLQVVSVAGTGDQLVLAVSLPRAIHAEVERTLPNLGLAGAPQMYFQGDQPLVSADQANAIVADIKRQLSVTLASSPVARIHLFLAGPAFLALLLGHRFNSLPPVQLYEWRAGFGYAATVSLGSVA